MGELMKAVAECKKEEGFLSALGNVAVLIAKGADVNEGDEAMEGCTPIFFAPIKVTIHASNQNLPCLVIHAQLSRMLLLGSSLFSGVSLPAGILCFKGNCLISA